MHTDHLRIHVDGGETVSAIFQVPAQATAACVLAHGAGAGMTHPFMAAMADGLAARGIATLRYQFPFMEKGTRRTDPPRIAWAAVRAAVATAAAMLPGTALVAGGKSFGGRMTSQAQADAPLPGVRGLVFLGFPLHPAGKPSDARAAHLAAVQVPMLFVQGSRDGLADPGLISAAVARLGQRARLQMVEGADHGFHVPVRSGRTDHQVLDEILDAAAAWLEAVDQPSE